MKKKSHPLKGQWPLLDIDPTGDRLYEEQLARQESAKVREAAHQGRMPTYIGALALLGLVMATQGLLGLFLSVLVLAAAAVGLTKWVDARIDASDRDVF